MKRALKLCVCVRACRLHSLFAQHRQKRTGEAFMAEEFLYNRLLVYRSFRYWVF
jgi:hypothetical protein